MSAWLTKASGKDPNRNSTISNFDEVVGDIGPYSIFRSRLLNGCSGSHMRNLLRNVTFAAALSTWQLPVLDYPHFAEVPGKFYHSKPPNLCTWHFSLRQLKNRSGIQNS